MMPIRLPDELPAVNFLREEKIFCYDNNKSKSSRDPSLESINTQFDAEKR
nr:Homoserine O-succinyltransferase [Providencia rettgeri]